MLRGRSVSMTYEQTNEDLPSLYILRRKRHARRSPTRRIHLPPAWWTAAFSTVVWRIREKPYLCSWWNLKKPKTRNHKSWKLSYVKYYHEKEEEEKYIYTKPNPICTNTICVLGTSTLHVISLLHSTRWPNKYSEFNALKFWISNSYCEFNCSIILTWYTKSHWNFLN